MDSFRHLNSIKAEEKRTRIPSLPTTVDYPIHRGDKKAVRLSHEIVCDIDLKSSRDRVRFGPFFGLIQDFKGSVFVLDDSGEAFEVRMSCDAVLLVFWCVLLGIVKNAHSGSRALDVVIESILRKVRCKSEHSGHTARKCKRGVRTEFP